MRTLLAAVAASGLVLLSGCGVASTQFHPGLAAQVEDGEVSSDEVDAATAAYCEYLVQDGTAADTPISLATLRSRIAGQLTLVEAARQFADELGVEPGKIYRSTVAASAADPTLKNLDEDQVDDLTTLLNSGAYLGDIYLSVGAQVVEARGGTLPAVPEQANDVAFPLGEKAFAGWIRSHDIEIDPRYDVELDGVTVKGADEGISYAQGDVARAGLKAALAEQQDPAAVAALPASQKCGGSGAATAPATPSLG